MKSSNNEDHRVVKRIIKVIRVDKDKKVIWRYKFKNYLKLLFTLILTIKLFLSNILNLLNELN